MPFVGQDGWPQQPEPSLRIDQQGAVGVGITGRVGHRIAWTPCRGAPALARPLDLDVISGALAGAVKPADQQIAAGRFDDARGVVVPMFEGKDQLRFQKRLLLGRRGGRRHESKNDKTNRDAAKQKSHKSKTKNDRFFIRPVPGPLTPASCVSRRQPLFSFFWPASDKSKSTRCS